MEPNAAHGALMGQIFTSSPADSAGEEERPRGRRPDVKRIGGALILLLVVVALVMPFISLNRFRGQMSSALSRAVGRDVSIGRMSLQLLPQPGFQLHDFNIAEDPSFGAEPMLHADSGTATLRLASLWRRRLEIASIAL